MGFSKTLAEQLIGTRPCVREKLRLAFIQNNPQVVLDVMDEIGLEALGVMWKDQEQMIWLSPQLQTVLIRTNDFTMKLARHGLPLHVRIASQGLAPRTALSLSIECGNVDHVRELLDRGADPNDYGVANEHPLNVVCNLRGPETVAKLVNVLLEAGADPDGYDTHYTPLFCLAEQGFIEPAPALLARGAHKTMSTITDRSVVEMARIKGHYEWADAIQAILSARELQENTPATKQTSERIRL